MAQTPVIKAENRTEFGKGASRRLRRDWRLPGVLYGHGIDPIHFHVDLLEMTALVRNDGVNAVLELEIEGEQHLAMVKHVDQNVLTLDIDHIDLLAIKRGEKVEVEVPIITEGEVAPGAQLLQDVDSILVEVDALKIPEELTVNVEGLEIGTQITAGELTLPDACTLLAEEDTLVINVTEEEIPDVPEEGEEAEAVEEGAPEDPSEVEATEESSQSEES
ncbi:50S ribosomal protein L25/general stress protein Ctc [Corynebacterium tapiri]|uniref:Large ribosomal subunit protein bL25 n=1 Tax=Corynebacterium tapiri TaxID=1448266 RepID=A0A5C4U6E5_9CORY|nr:50S ribosomal protein L25/general stress protein Ctc [Corynebacterium tapiri]TNM00472.1 50S ribosomal protein L25/general stress protein Ctc [Corynebacterium tapiri]